MRVIANERRYCIPLHVVYFMKRMNLHLQKFFFRSKQIDEAVLRVPSKSLLFCEIAVLLLAMQNY